jgi:cyclic beta-1,2-glucan synthetase
MTEALQVHPARDPGRSSEETPLRAELLSGERLEQHARALAEWHKLDPKRGADLLLPRLRENEQVLQETHTLITHAVKKERRITPAAEWLLDNFYLVEEQIRLARRHLPPPYSRQLPRIAAGPAKGYPRVYDIALELISHVDGQVDSENLRGFIGAYQSKVALTLGELWAVPIMLRLALIENLRRVATRIAGGRRDRERANDWADRLLETAERDPRNVVLVLADMVRAAPSLSSPFVAELTRRLQGQGPALQFPIAWIEARLSESGLTAAEIVQQVSQSQAADQASIGNSVSSLRFLASTDWRDFVEATSVVEEILRTDPAGVYPRMDFRTRNDYRQAVERLARRSEHGEEAIAQTVVALARDGKSPNGGPAHVGSFLVDDSRGGVAMLERAVQARRDLGMALDRWALRHPIGPYIGGIAVVV